MINLRKFKNINKTLLIAIIVIIFVGIVGTITYAKVSMTVNKSIDKVFKNRNRQKHTATDEHRKSIFTTMHKIANSKIIAEDGLVWGELEPTEDIIKGLIKDVSGTDYEDKDYLLEVLNRWKKDDFSKCVEEHNYIWENLKGEVGKANSLR